MGKTRAELIKERLFTKDFYTKKEWWGMGETILDDEEVKKEPLIVRKALAVRYTLRNMPAAIRDYELVAGVPNNSSVGLGREMPKFTLPEEEEWAWNTHCMTPKQYGDNHPGDYGKLLRLGVKGIREEIYEKIAAGADEEAMELYRAMLISLDAVVEFARRYSDLCLKESAKAESTERAKELANMAGILSKVPEYPAESFHEAVQSFWIFYTVLHSTMEMMPAGRTDQYLYPYYEKDIQEGKITKEEAREILTCLLAKFSERVQLNLQDWEWNHTTPADENLGGADPDSFDKFAFEMANDADWNLGSSANHFLLNMVLGGVKPDGTDATNDLTYMILEQASFLETVAPILSVRISRNTPRTLLRLIAKVLRTGRGEPAIYCDDNVIPGLVANGVALEDARNFTNDGCWEINIQGMTNYYYGNVHVLQILEYFMNHGESLVRGKSEWRDCGDVAECGTFDEFYERYMEEVKDMACSVVDNHIKHFWAARHKIAPSPLLSTITDDCIAKGRDITHGGCRYNIYGLQIIGFSHAVDSLAAIKKMVYEEKRITMEELLEAVRTDFEGKEELRRMLIHDVPKYGNDDPYVDQIAARFLKDFGACVKEKNKEDEVVKERIILEPACGTFEHYVMLGKQCGASPDGRSAEHSIASNYSPSLGLDTHGPTSVLKSACYPDLLPFYSGGPIDLGINANEIEGEEGVDRLIGIINAFSELGGMLMTLQVLNTDTLKDAQKHPESYPNLRVRLGGMSVFFTQLAKLQQDTIIERVVKKS